MTLELVIFDCDGVLVDSEVISNRVLAAMLTEQGLPTTLPQARREYQGMLLADVLARAEVKLGRSLPADWLARYEDERSEAFRRELQPVTGAAETIERLRGAGPRVCVASQGKLEKTRLSLALTGLDRLLPEHVRFSAYSVANGKPAPDLFLHAAATIGVEPAACVVVEDTPSGVQAAVAAGMRAIGYTADSDERALVEAGAEPLDSVGDLPRLLGQDEGLAASRAKPARTVGRAPLTVAVAQPRCRPNDVPANARAHASLIRSARARLIVFPELSLTGYELDAEPISPDAQALMSIVEACTEANSVALVGAPVVGLDGRLHIGMLRIEPNAVDVAYRKCYLGGEEPVRFAPGDGPAAFELDGWRIGLGICKDTGAQQHILATADLDIDLYAAGLVHVPSELAMQENRAVRIVRACAAYVAFASFAGPTGGGFDRTAGVSSIWSTDGTALARAGFKPDELACATLN